MEYGICPLRRPSRNSWISRELCLIDVSVYSIYWNYVTPAIDLSSDRSIQRPNLLWFCVRLFIDNYAGKEENLSCDLTAIIAFVLNKSTVNKHRPTPSAAVFGVHAKWNALTYVMSSRVPRRIVYWRYLPGNKFRLHLIACLVLSVKLHSFSMAQPECH